MRDCRMPVERILLLVAAGVGGGLAGSVAGLASLVSYPALLAAGLSPVAANVTNTVALVFGGAGAVVGSRVELVGQRVTLQRLAGAGAAGGLAGAALLLVTPSSAFTLVVPWLIGAAAIAILLRRRRSGPIPPAVPLTRSSWRLTAATFTVAVYGGYFGAAAGVLLLALLLAALGQSVVRTNAAKNLILGTANAVAAVAFVVLGPVHWAEAIPLAVGFLVGGRLGPIVARVLPGDALRVLIAVAGLGLAVHLGLSAYR